MGRTAFAIPLVITILAGLLHAATLRVPQDFGTIQTAIDSAQAGDTVLVDDDTYTESIRFHGKGILVTSRFLTSGDSSHIAATVIDGSTPAHPDSGSVVYFIDGEDSSAVLYGVTVTGGSGTVLTPPLLGGQERAGGGIFIHNAAPTIRHCRITGNSIALSHNGYGAGVFAIQTAPGGRIRIDACAITDNGVGADSMALGAGILSGTNLVVTGSRLDSNTTVATYAGFGAALLAADFFGTGVTLTLDSCRIGHNQSAGLSQASAAVHVELPEFDITGNRIHDNRAQAPAVLAAGVLTVIGESTATVRGNAIVDNTVVSNAGIGGGLTALFSSGLPVTDNRISGNVASAGAGIATWYASPVLHRNRITGNAGEVGAGLWLNRYPFAALLPGGVSINAIALLTPTARLQAVADRLLAPAGDADTRVLNCTLADNQADYAGAAITCEFGSASVINSILYGNVPAGDSAAIRGVAEAQYSLIEGGYPGAGNIDLPPLFQDAVDYHLDPASPAVDAGHPDPAFNDREDPANPGFPLWPAQGTLRNDMGYTGGDPDATPGVPILYGGQFRAFVERVTAAPYPDRVAIIDSFLLANPVMPFIEGDNVAVFIYRGTGNSVTLPGDANGWDPTAFPMTQLAGTNFWYWQDIYEPDARLDYKFVINGSNWILDPRNPRQVSGGFGPNSELAMPGYVDPPEILRYADIPHGTGWDSLITSTELNNSRRVWVYMPPGYDPDGTVDYPMILFHDGGEYRTLGSAYNVFDYLIAEQRIEPVVAVFVPPVNRDQEYAYGQRNAYERFIVNELLSILEGRFRIAPDPARRAMTGPSFGGLITTQIVYRNPDKFGLGAPISPSYWVNNGAIMQEVLNGPQEAITWYLDWGTYEPGIMLDARTMVDGMGARGYAPTWNEWHEGHSWGSWRAHLDNFLELFFPGPALTLADGDRPLLPRELELAPNYPNPFNPSTRVAFGVPEAGQVRLEIFDITGRRVATLVDERVAAGWHEVTWRGRDGAGRAVASGVYIYRLEAGGRSVARRMVLVR